MVPLLSVIRRNRDRPYNSALRQDVDAVEKRARDIIDSNPALARQMPAAVQRYAAEKKQLRAKKTRSKLRVVKGGA